MSIDPLLPMHVIEKSAIGIQHQLTLPPVPDGLVEHISNKSLPGKRFQELSDPFISSLLACWHKVAMIENWLIREQMTGCSYQLKQGIVQLVTPDSHLLNIPAAPLAIVRRLWSEHSFQLEWSFHDDELLDKLPEDTVELLLSLRTAALNSQRSALMSSRSRSTTPQDIPFGLELISMTYDLISPYYVPILIEDKNHRLGDGVWFMVEKLRIPQMSVESLKPFDRLMSAYSFLWEHYPLLLRYLGTNFNKCIQAFAESLSLKHEQSMHTKLGACLAISTISNEENKTLLCPLDGTITRCSWSHLV